MVTLYSRESQPIRYSWLKNAVFLLHYGGILEKTLSEKPHKPAFISRLSKVWKFNGDDKELVAEERDDRFVWPTRDLFSVQLFSPVSWEPIAGTK